MIHGDQFDVVVKYAKWLAHIGDKAYVLLLAANHWLNIGRRRMGFSYWSLSAYMKQRAKRAVEYIGRFQHALSEEARRRDLDGVVCGHIHTAEFKDMDGLVYCNDGDWVESCTALVEHESGELEILLVGGGGAANRGRPDPPPRRRLTPSAPGPSLRFRQALEGRGSLGAS